jgi:hypothetical protein
LVKKVEWSSNVNKAISEAIKTVSGPKSTLKDRSVYLFSASPEEGKVVHGCYVAEVRSLALLYPSLGWTSMLTCYCSNTKPPAPMDRNGLLLSRLSLAARLEASLVRKLRLGRARMRTRWMRVSKRRGSSLRASSCRTFTLVCVMELDVSV